MQRSEVRAGYATRRTPKNK